MAYIIVGIFVVYALFLLRIRINHLIAKHLHKWLDK